MDCERAKILRQEYKDKQHMNCFEKRMKREIDLCRKLENKCILEGKKEQATWRQIRCLALKDALRYYYDTFE